LPVPYADVAFGSDGSLRDESVAEAMREMLGELVAAAPAPALAAA
jgi:hypothetical protein